jgi:hypothetical protein
LGEKDVDVSAFPDKPRPRKIWHAAEPKAELDRLCSEFNCAPAFSPFTNKAYIVKLGKGRRPPNTPNASRSDSFVNRARPDAIRIIGGKTLFQTALLLGDWLALEVDGTYVPMDEVSYKPEAGWGSVWPLNFAGLNTTYKDPATKETLYHRDLAQRSVWRVARIRGQSRVVGDLDRIRFSPEILEGTDLEPKSAKDLGPFSGKVLEKDPLTGERMEAYARGVFIDQRFAMKNSPAKTRWPGSIQIDSDKRLVIFDRPCFKLDANNRHTKTTMELIASYEVSHEGVPIRFELDRAASQKIYNAGELREHREEIVHEFIEKTASYTGKEVDNLKQCFKKANFYLDQLAEQFNTLDGTTAEYLGLEQFSLDGVLRSVSWSFSVASLPRTAASWNTEANRLIAPWEDRKEARQQRQMDYNVRQVEAQRRRDASSGKVIVGGPVA